MEDAGRWQPVDLMAPQAMTFEVERMTVACPCGCGALTAIQCHRFVLAHLWPDQIRFTLKLRWVERIVAWMLRGGIKGRLVLLEFADGSRVQCPPSAMFVGARGDFATVRDTPWKIFLPVYASGENAASEAPHPEPVEGA